MRPVGLPRTAEQGAARARPWIGYLRERTKLTEAAIAILGVLQNIEAALA